MTDQELNELMIKAAGWKHEPRFDGDVCGYYVLGGRRVISEEMPDYCNDFNEIYQAECVNGLKDRSNPSLRVKWQNSVHKVLSAAVDCPKNKAGSALVSDIDCLLMTARQRVEAFVLTFSEVKVK